MEFKEVDKQTEENILGMKDRNDIIEMLKRFQKSNLKVVEVSEEGVKRYKSPKSARMTINLSLKKYNKQNTAFITVCLSKGKVYLINRSVE